MEVDERRLLQAARQGDDDAFGRLIQPHLDAAYRLAVRILDRPVEAEDAVQEAMVKAWRALPRFRGRAKFSTWLYRIVWNECVDRTRRREALTLDADPISPDVVRQPESYWEQQELQDELEHALRSLPVPYRTVLVLYYIEDMSVRDIAGIVGLPGGTVKTHLHRARLALRELLSNSDEGDDGEGKKEARK